MSVKNKIYKRAGKPDRIDRSILIAFYLVLLLILSVDLVSRNFHVKPPDHISRLNHIEQVSKP